MKIDDLERISLKAIAANYEYRNTPLFCNRARQLRLKANRRAIIRRWIKTLRMTRSTDPMVIKWLSEQIKWQIA